MNTAVMTRTGTNQLDRESSPVWSVGGIELSRPSWEGVRAFGRALIDVPAQHMAFSFSFRDRKTTGVMHNWALGSNPAASARGSINKFEIFSTLKFLSEDCDHDALKRSMADALQFLGSYSSELPQPTIHTSDDGEVLFNWKVGSKRAKVSFDGEGSYGYALLIDGKYRGGQHSGVCSEEIPADLVDYLKG